MPEQASRQAWVDRYIRNQLSADEMAAFETEMLESPALQEELEVALALRTVLMRESEEAPRELAEPPSADAFERRAGWQSLALAASLILAVLSTVMWWKVGSDSAALERQMEALVQPRGELLTVPVPIMRSEGSRSPDVIVRKPHGRAAILLDIELGLRSREEMQLELALVDADGKPVLSWQSAPGEDGRTTAVIPSEQIPASRLWLQISAAGGEVLERRLLEFR